MHVGTVAAGQTTFEDRRAVPGRTYTYRVRAIDGTTTSAYSNEVSVTAPTGHAALTLAGTQGSNR